MKYMVKLKILITLLEQREEALVARQDLLLPNVLLSD
jgi:hypothetical protein